MFLDRKPLKIRAERCLAQTTQSSMCALKFNLWSTNTPRSLTVLEFRISWTESIYVGVVKLPIVKMLHLEYDMPICQVFAQSWTASRYFWNLITSLVEYNFWVNFHIVRKKNRGRWLIKQISYIIDNEREKKRANDTVLRYATGSRQIVGHSSIDLHTLGSIGQKRLYPEQEIAFNSIVR